LKDRLQDAKASGITHVVVPDAGFAALPPPLRPGGTAAAASSAVKPGRSHSADGHVGGGAMNIEALADTASEPDELELGAADVAPQPPSKPGDKPRSGDGRDDRLPPKSGSQATPAKGAKKRRAPDPGPPPLQYVSHLWVERSLAQQRLLPAADFPPPLAEAEVPTPAGGGDWSRAWLTTPFLLAVAQGFAWQVMQVIQTQPALASRAFPQRGLILLMPHCRSNAQANRILAPATASEAPPHPAPTI
jgi:hypothetical protein